MRSGSRAPFMFRETLTVHFASRPFAFRRFHARSIAAPSSSTFPNFPIRSGIVQDSTWSRANEPSSVDTVHQPDMFIIRRCTHTYTHIYTYARKFPILVKSRATRHRERQNARSRHFLLSSLDPRPARNGQKILLSHFRTFYLRHGSEVVVVAVSGIVDPRYPRIRRTKNLSLSLSLPLETVDRGTRKKRKEGTRNGWRGG